MPIQKLSPKAAAAKKKRDLKIALTPRRTRMKAENQRKRRAAKKAGKNIEGKDWDHNTNSFTSVKTNRSATKTTNNTMNKKPKKKPTKVATKDGPKKRRVPNKPSAATNARMLKKMKDNKKKKK